MGEIEDLEEKKRLLQLEHDERVKREKLLAQIKDLETKNRLANEGLIKKGIKRVLKELF